MDVVDGRRGYVAATGEDFAVKAQEAHNRLLELEKLPCITFDETSGTELDRWLQANRPDTVPMERARYIAVRRSDRIRQLDDMQRIDLRLGQRRWSSIEVVARELDYLSGAWMFFVPPSGVNKMWRQVAKLVWSKGEWNGKACAAKVSTRQSPDSQHERQRDSNHCLLVFNRDCTDYEQVVAVERALRQLGVTERIMYKPEIYSRLGIYSGNGLTSPTTYLSTFNRKTKESSIEDKREGDDQQKSAS